MSKKTEQDQYRDGFDDSFRWIESVLADLEFKYRDLKNEKQPYWKGYSDGVSRGINMLKEIKKSELGNPYE